MKERRAKEKRKSKREINTEKGGKQDREKEANITRRLPENSRQSSVDLQSKKHS